MPVPLRNKNGYRTSERNLLICGDCAIFRSNFMEFGKKITLRSVTDRIDLVDILVTIVTSSHRCCEDGCGHCIGSNVLG